MNLKNKYNKLFAGKPKSNDQMLTEGSVFLGIGNSGRRINEEEVGMDYTTLLESLETAASDLEQVLQEIDSQLQDDMAMSYEAKQARVTINRYASAVMKNLQGIEKTLQGL